MRINNFLKLVIAIVVSEFAGVIGSLFTAPAIRSDWYLELAKPALNPPAWVFGPVWTTLYALMGLSAWLVWKKNDEIAASSLAPRNDKRIKIALGIFLGQLVF